MTKFTSWIQSDGGPLICVLASAAHGWCGIDGGGADGKENGGTDYDQACSISDYVGLVQFNGSSAIVLGDAPMATSIADTEKYGTYIVRILYANSEDDVVKCIDNYDGISGKKSEEKVMDFKSDGSGILIFDSAYSGSVKIMEMISYHLEAGDYQIDTRIIEKQGSYSIVLHKISAV